MYGIDHEQFRIRYYAEQIELHSVGTSTTFEGLMSGFMGSTGSTGATHGIGTM